MKTKSTKKAAPRKASTALAVRPKKTAKPLITIEDPKGLMAGNLLHVGQLGELATVGALGLAELKLTPEEDAILAEPVDPSLIQYKPRKKDGPPEIPYLPHVVYTRWFHRAFGRTGWAAVPTAKPQKAGNLVMMPYLLYIHGVPVAYAMGEQEYHENNLQQTYGDVIESTVASALRRFAKRLGVGLEMWDKDWLTKNAIPPHLRGKARRAASVDPEAARGESLRSFVDQPEWVEDPNVATHTVPSQLESQKDGPKLTPQQRQRLGSIATKAGRSTPDVQLWLKKVYGVSSSAGLLQKDYAEICRVLESRGALPLPGDGQ